MSWKYLNPGDYRLLHGYNSAVKYNSKLLAPRTGMAFYNGTNTYPITIPAGVKEIWCRFSVAVSYASDSVGSIIWGTSSYSATNSVQVFFAGNYLYLGVNRSLNNASNYTKQFYKSTLPLIWDVWLHIKSASSNGLVELYLDGNFRYSTTANIFSGEDIKCYYVCGKTVAHTFSDIIISDEPIDLNEHCAVLPIRQTTADGWQYNDSTNIYTADSAEKTIWQVPDITQLKKEIGVENPTITSVATQIFSASTNDTETVDRLKKQIRYNSSTVTVSSHTLATTAYRFISPAVTANPITNESWTLSSLANTEFGITTAKS